MSDLQACRGFKWKVFLCDENQSSDFRVGNCEWYLSLNSRSEDINFRNVLICPKKIQDTPFRPFKFTCFYKQGTSNSSNGLLSKEIGRPIEHWLWSFEVRFQELTVVFVFDEDISLELRTDSGEELPVSDLSSLSSDLGALLASGDSSDVKLKTESGTRSAHRSVLACRSQYFSGMFNSGMKESRSGLVEIKDMDGAVFDLFLEYLYTGRFPGNLGADTLAQLYSAADKYAVHSLKKLCGDVMSRSLTRENHQALLVLADAHSDERLKGIVIESIVEMPDWLNCEGFKQFSKEHPVLANEVFLKFIEKTFKK